MELKKQKSEQLQTWQEKFSNVQVSSINEIIKSGKPSIASVKKQYGDEVVKAMLFLEIEALYSFVNIGKNMNQSQIIETVKLIQKNYFSFTLLDFKLFFERMKIGYYGQFYDRLDGSVILSNLMKYEDERMQEYEVYRAKENRDVKKVNAQPLHPKVLEIMKNAAGEKKAPKPRPKQKRDPLIDRWMKQFDNLFLKYGESKGVRSLVIKGKRIDITEFLKIKIENYEIRS